MKSKSFEIFPVIENFTIEKNNCNNLIARMIMDN